AHESGNDRNAGFGPAGPWRVRRRTAGRALHDPRGRPGARGRGRPGGSRARRPPPAALVRPGLRPPGRKLDLDAPPAGPAGISPGTARLAPRAATKGRATRPFVAPAT